MLNQRDILFLTIVFINWNLYYLYTVFKYYQDPEFGQCMIGDTKVTGYLCPLSQ